MIARIVPATALMILAGSISIAHALEKGPDGWYKTGSGVRTKTVAFVSVDVYAIQHFMKELPPTKSKAAVLAADVDKKIVWRMLRDVGADKIQDALADGYEMNGYKDKGRMQKALSVFKDELKEGTRVEFLYDSTKKSTRVTAGAHSVEIDGLEFMKATWSIWFGKFDDPDLADALIGIGKS